MCCLLLLLLRLLIVAALSGSTVTAPVRLRHKWSEKWLRHARINVIKQEILSKLGMSAVPDVSRVNTTLEEKRSMLRLYKKGLQDANGQLHTLYGDEQFFAKTFHSFPEIGERRSAIDPEMWNNISSLTFAFNIDIATPKNTTQQVYIESATLKLYKLRVKPHNMRNRMSVDDQVRVNVYQLLSDIANVTNGTQDIRKLLDSRLVSLETLGWEKFDISSAVDVWLRHPERNFGVEVACHHQVLGAVVEFAIPSADWQDAELRRELTPHVDVYSRRKPVQARRKRSDEKFDCTQGDGEQRCCRYPLWISFEHIGWSGWVVAPDGYKAYYCDGTCPYRYKIAHTFAAIQSLINKNNPSAVPAPCCTAAKLSPFTLLHYNNKDQLVVSVYDDMVIDECMCA